MGSHLRNATTHIVCWWLSTDYLRWLALFLPSVYCRKAFFLAFFSDFRSTDFGENAWKTLDPPYLVLRNWKKRSLKKRRRGKKGNAHDGLFGRIVQSVCTFMYKTTTSRIISFLALKHVRTQWITKWSTKRPATCSLLAEAETNFLKYFKYSELKGAIFYFILALYILKQQHYM